MGRDMAQFETDVKIIVNPDGTFYPVTPPVAVDSEVEGLISDGQGGREGYADGELGRIYDAIANGQTEGLTGRVILCTSPEKMVKWHNVGWEDKDGKKIKFKVKEFKSEKALEKKNELLNGVDNEWI